MGKQFKFSVIKFEAHPVRDERLNVGIAVVSDKGLDVRITRRLTKLQSISAALDFDSLRDALYGLPDLYEFIVDDDEFNDEDAIEQLSKLAVCTLVPGGSFSAQTEIEYESRIQTLLNDLVDPEKDRVVRPKKRRTKVKRDIEGRLKKIGILGKRGDELESHQVIPNHLIAEGVEVDLMLRNGYYHILETVDVIQDSISPKRVFSEIGFTTIVFEQAKMVYGDHQIVPRLIYQASAELESVAAPALAAVEHQGVELVNWESSNDRNRLIDILANLAATETKKPGGDGWVDASTKSRVQLN